MKRANWAWCNRVCHRGFVSSSDDKSVPVFVHSSKSMLSKARSVADMLQLQMISDFSLLPVVDELFVLQFQSNIIQYLYYERKGKKMKEKSVFSCNYEDSTLQNRMAQQSIANSPLLKAIGFVPTDNEEGTLTVLDGTAGLAEDSFLMAHYAKKVILVERSPYLYPILENGIIRAKESTDYETRRISEKIHLQPCMDSIEVFENLHEQHIMLHPDVIFLDPMHEEKYAKSALPKFKMQLARKLVGRGEANDHRQLLEKAMKVAQKRVVFKRPANSAIDKSATFSITAGRAIRYDVYTTQGNK